MIAGNIASKTEQLRELHKVFQGDLTKNLPDWFNLLQVNAMKALVRVGFPTRKDELWRYTDVLPVVLKRYHLSAGPIDLQRADIGKFMLPGAVNLVFLNGYLQPQLSDESLIPQGVTIQPLENIISSSNMEHFVEQFGYQDNTQLHGFQILHRAFMKQGMVIQVEPNTVINPLIHLVHISGASKKILGVEEPSEHVSDTILLNTPFFSVNVGGGSQVRIIESYHNLGVKSSFTNVLSKYVVQRDARLVHYKLHNESPETYHMGYHHFEQHTNSELESVNVAIGGKIARHELVLKQVGEHCRLKLWGLFAACFDHHVDLLTKIHHQGKSGRSEQLYKGVLGGDASAVFQGNITIDQIAKETEAKQLNKNLLLSKHATINSKPQLQIATDDVKCMHGATTGQLNDDEIFYLASRGITQDEAARIICKGFVDDILNKMEDKFLGPYVHNIITHKGLLGDKYCAADKKHSL